MHWTPFSQIWKLVIARVRELKDANHLTLEQVGAILGVNKSTVMRWLSGDRGGEATTADDLFRYLEALGVRPSEIFSDPLPAGDDYAFIRKARARPTAGGGSLETTGETEGGLAFRRDWLRSRTPAGPERLRVMEVSGDSMAPTINHGDVVLVDESDNARELGEDRVYVVRKGDEIYVKRYHKTPDALLFMGDNRARDYQDVRVVPGETEQFAGIGRVLWAGKEL